MSEDRDHKKIGKELELFTFSDVVGKGLPLWLPKGAAIRRELERFIVDEEIKRGYLHVKTPDIARLDLYKKSGHYPHYKDSMYAPIVIDDEEFMLRPMTCPHHFELYLTKPRSYRDLPMRIAELAQLYRYEQSGELMGIIRARTFCLSDAHIICKNEEEAVEEMGKALDLIEYANKIFGLDISKDYWYRLSLGDRANTEKYYKDDVGWEKAEELLRKLMEERGVKFEEVKDEASFYGPKIDVQMKNANGKEDTIYTVQYDLSSPQRFELDYIGEDGKPHRAFVVHRSSIGAIERMVAFLIEKYMGAFPLWLAPIQVKVLPIGEGHFEYAKEVHQQLMDEGIRSELDESNESLGKKIRNAKTEKVFYMLVIGDKEVSDNVVTVEGRDPEGKPSTSNGAGSKLGAMSVDEFVSKVKDEIKKKK